jgi:hypothetical protein
MITERNIRHAMKYCRDDYRKIPGYERALKEPGRFLVHHVLGLTINGEHAHDHKELKRLGMYYNRPFFELQWMSLKDHGKIHKNAKPVRMIGEKNPMYGKGYPQVGEKNPMFGKHLTESQKKSISKSLSGERNYLYGVKGEKHPAWKGDKASIITKYRRAGKLYKEGKITEEELQPYRDEWIEYKKSRKKQTGVQPAESR